MCNYMAPLVVQDDILSSFDFFQKNVQDNAGSFLAGTVFYCLHCSLHIIIFLATSVANIADGRSGCFLGSIGSAA